MSVEAHIRELEKKHQALEAELHQLNLSPSTADAEISIMKRKKLQLKDEITRLQSGSTH